MKLAPKFHIFQNPLGLMLMSHNTSHSFSRLLKNAHKLRNKTHPFIVKRALPKMFGTLNLALNLTIFSKILHKWRSWLFSRLLKNGQKFGKKINTLSMQRGRFPRLRDIEVGSKIYQFLKFKNDVPNPS